MEVYDDYKSQTPLVLDFENTQVKGVNELPINQPDSSLGTSRKRQRKSNFTYQEDLMLVSAWLNVSLDRTPGTREKHRYKTYWERVHAYFQQHKQFSSDRSPSSLMHRWSVIQIAVTKFQEYLSQIEAASQSERMEEDKICEALEMYKDLQKTSFTFYHCWNELRQSPKFCLKKKSRNSRSSTLSSLPTHDSIGMEDNGHSNESALEPAIETQVSKECSGRFTDVEDDALEPTIETQISKECSRKTTGRSADVEDDANVKLVNTKDQQKHEGKALAAGFLKIERDREEREKRKEEREQILFEQKILAADSSSMNEYEVEYYISLKQAIVEKRRNFGFDL